MNRFLLGTVGASTKTRCSVDMYSSQVDNFDSLSVGVPGDQLVKVRLWFSKTASSKTFIGSATS